MTSYRPFQRKLLALEYPNWKKFNIQSMEDIKTLVVYLEQTKIRELKVADRTNLKNTKSQQWLIYFGLYLREMDAPFAINRSRSRNSLSNNEWIEIIEWLISQAILRMYQDDKQQYNQRKPIRRIDKREYALTDCNSTETEINLQHLCQFLNIPCHQNPIITCQTLYSFIKTKFNATSIANYELLLKEKAKEVEAGGSQEQKAPAQHQPRSQSSFAADHNRNMQMDAQFDSFSDANANSSNVSQFNYWDRSSVLHESDPYLKLYDADGVLKHYAHYLGFSSGDKYVDAAAVILRILYVMDVRQSQNQLNEIVNYLQQFTANPKTNPKLGKVGR